ncbi:MAG: helix-turn-helix domain-containing protein [Rhodospirillaceae bacterium]|nr:helix-turn-helix domain-containing protein [Rhodospirillaceae bacterium]
MNGNGNAEADNVVRLRLKKETGRASEKKWGKEVIARGFCIVPSLLLRAQNRLGLNPTQFAVLMQLCDFWWERDRKPYPGKAVLAERLGLSARQVQRHIRGPRNGRARQTPRAQGHPWRKADQHVRPRRAGGAA